MVEVAVIEPANSQTDINATYTMEAKQKQINKKEFKSIGDRKNNCAYVATNFKRWSLDHLLIHLNEMIQLEITKHLRLIYITQIPRA
jgi:hypothetical protein